MTSILSDFVAVTKQGSDVLPPASHRSIVEMIFGILKKYNFSAFKSDSQKLSNHLADYNNPHHDDHIDFFDDIVAHTYSVYINMLSAPLSLSDFKSQIVPTLGFIELFRRIMLNRYLYNQVKLADGSVPANANVYLSQDWAGLGFPTGPTTLTFHNGVASEVEFIKLGWRGNAQPYPVVFDAIDLTGEGVHLPVLFEAGLGGEYYSHPNPQGKVAFPLHIASNDFTIKFQIVGTPQILTPIFSLTSKTDLLQVAVDSDASITVLLNSAVMLKTPGPVNDGHGEIVISRYGYMALQTYSSGVKLYQEKAPFFFIHDAPLEQGIIEIDYTDGTSDSFGLRDLTLFRGYTRIIPQPDYSAPPGYALLTDRDGNILFDPDGAPLMDYDFAIPDGWNLLLDDDNSFLVDNDGTFIAEIS